MSRLEHEKMRICPRFLCLAAIALLAAACSDDDGGGNGSDASADTRQSDTALLDGGDENVNEEGCEHTKEGPFVPPMGTDAPDAGTDAAGAVVVTPTHHGSRVAITADQQGWVKFDADEAGELLIFLSEDVAFGVEDDTGQPIELEETSVVTECAEVAVRHTIDVAGAGAIFFKLGGGAQEAGEIIIVLEEGGDHGEHGDT